MLLKRKPSLIRRLAGDTSAATAVEFAIYDLAGREVWATKPHFAAGHHTLQWNGRAASGGTLAPGLYLARVRADGLTRVRRFVLVH